MLVVRLESSEEVIRTEQHIHQRLLPQHGGHCSLLAAKIAAFLTGFTWPQKLCTPKSVLAALK